jgi:hypothetical protein
MTIPTEPIGSIPRPLRLIEAVAATEGMDPALDPLYEEAIRDTVERFEATGSPVITDGEQRKYHNFWTYCVHGLPNTAPDGFKIPFAAGHTDLNNLALSRFLAEDRLRIGVHTCPGSDLDSTHSADIDYAELLPSVLKIIRERIKPDQRVFVGVIAPIDPRVETPPFCDDKSTTRDTAFAKIRARVLGTGLASKKLGIG